MGFSFLAFVAANGLDRRIEVSLSFPALGLEVLRGGVSGA
jgi:hypothetical protein